MSGTDGQDILPAAANVPAGQGKAGEASTTVEYLANLQILSRVERIRLSGIVCTIGPVSKSPAFLFNMIDSGMNVARMNFSHGSHDYHAETIANCRKAAEMYEKRKGVNPCLAIALDTKGPEIRTGLLEGDDGRKEVRLKEGDVVRITTDEAFEDRCTAEIVYVDYKNICKVMSEGKRIYVDDGLISVRATEVGVDHIMGVVENGGNLGSRKGCNLPGTNCDLPAVSEKDKKDLLFGVRQKVDVVFASFVRNAAGVREIRKVLGEEGKDILVVPKIEDLQGVGNIDEIIAEADGIMVARGDMGIEIPPEKVFIAQKQIVAKCNLAGIPVICATQMLESMVNKPRPTRAEASDVANAILDGSDCVMLSGETAKGEYAVQCVKTMAALAREAEACLWNRRFFEDVMRAERKEVKDVTASIAIAAVQASYAAKAGAIVAVTATGRTAHIVSKYRPRCPIVAVTGSATVARQMQLFRGIVPLLDERKVDDEGRIRTGVDFGKKKGFLRAGDLVVCVTGRDMGPGSSDTVRMLEVK